MQGNGVSKQGVSASRQQARGQVSRHGSQVSKQGVGQQATPWQGYLYPGHILGSPSAALQAATAWLHLVEVRFLLQAGYFICCMI